MVKSCDFNLFYTASKVILQTPTIYKKLLQLHTSPAIRNSNTAGVNFFKLAKFTQTPHLFAVRRLSMLKSTLTNPSLNTFTSFSSTKLFNGSLSSNALIYSKNFLHIQGSFLPNYNTALQPDRRWKLKFLTLDYARIPKRKLLKTRAAMLRTISKKHLLRVSYRSSTGTHNPKLTKLTLYNTLFKILRTSVLDNVNTSPMFTTNTNIRLKRTRVRIKRLFNWYTSRPFLFTNTRPGKVIFSDNFLKSTLFTTFTFYKRLARRMSRNKVRYGAKRVKGVKFSIPFLTRNRAYYRLYANQFNTCSTQVIQKDGLARRYSQYIVTQLKAKTFTSLVKNQESLGYVRQVQERLRYRKLKVALYSATKFVKNTKNMVKSVMRTSKKFVTKSKQKLLRQQVKASVNFRIYPVGSSLKSVNPVHNLLTKGQNQFKIYQVRSSMRS